MNTETQRSPLTTTTALIGQLAQRFSGEADSALVDSMVREFLRLAGNALATGNRVQLDDFGLFRIAIDPAKKRRNPATGGTVQSPEAARVRFKANKKLFDRVQKVLG